MHSYYAIPDLEKQIKELEAAQLKAKQSLTEGTEGSKPMLSENVTADQVWRA